MKRRRMISLILPVIGETLHSDIWVLTGENDDGSKFAYYSWGEREKEDD